MVSGLSVGDWEGCAMKMNSIMNIKFVGLNTFHYARMKLRSRQLMLYSSLPAGKPLFISVHLLSVMQRAQGNTVTI